MSLSCPFSHQMKVNSNEQVGDAERTFSGRKRWRDVCNGCIKPDSAGPISRESGFFTAAAVKEQHQIGVLIVKAVGLKYAVIDVAQPVYAGAKRGYDEFAPL
ncbi:hypothetical protein [Pectobacterium brasiliense]|uniref:hypothetical protein n=1 Tax=Pectobacterium brasiliense TaxID=180957 RepID=UPI0032ECE671